MDAGRPDPCTRPGARVIAVCDLPPGTHGHAAVVGGTLGEIVRTPAYFSTSYSIRFDVNGIPVTLHRINRHEFRLLDEAGHEIEPGFPPADRYPQPAPELADVGSPAAGEDAESG